MSEDRQTIRAVIVGAGGGIGSALCELMFAAGDEAFLIGRNAEKLKVLGEKYGWGYAAADTSQWDELERNISSAEGVLGGINAAVNLAGSVLIKPMHLTSQSEWDATIRTNLSTAAGLVRTIAPRMFGAGGSIVLMSSAAGRLGLQNHEAIAAAKAGVDGLVRSAAATYAAKNIRINSIAPGLVRSPLTERIWSNERSADVSLSLHPIGRFGEPVEVARGIHWLMHPDQSWMTGQTIGMDGGLGGLKTIRA